MNMVEDTAMQSSVLPLPSGGEAGCCYIPSDCEKLFTWLQIPAGSLPRRGVAVLCTSLGYEYMSLHRSVRALANRLADEGIASLRFDYRGTGDSSGQAFASNQITGFVTDVTSVIETAKSMFGELPVILIGIGLGGTFAALAAVSTAVDTLVLWNACVNGRKFVREQQMLSKMLDKSQVMVGESVIDAAGIVMPASMVEDLKAIDLRKHEPFQCRHALVLARDDIPEDRSLPDAIAASGIGVDYYPVPGYADMVTFPTDTKIPDLAMDILIQALDLPTATGLNEHGSIQHLLAQKSRSLTGPDMTMYADLEEAPLIFGRKHHLFGVLCRNRATAPDTRSDVALVFLNCGSEHHVGPHRLYTDLSRQLAAQGLLCFRFDIEGIGDSPANGENADNYSYSPVALQDIQEALSYLQSTHQCKRFVLTGICAGAYHSFTAAVTLEDYPIVGSILINPLVFEWQHSKYADTAEQDGGYTELAYYRGALFQPKSWLKLLRGGVDPSHLARVALRQVTALTTALFNRLLGLFGKNESTKLAKEIRYCMSADRKLSMIFAEGDPGYVILMTEAPSTVSKGIKSEMVAIDLIQGADHGFSMSYMRKDLATLFEERIAHLLQN